MLFDFLVVSQVVQINPASSEKVQNTWSKKERPPSFLQVRRASCSPRSRPARRGIARSGAHRNHGLYLCARLGRHQNGRQVQGRRTWVRLHGKGGKRHEMPCHHNLEEYLEAYMSGAGIAADGKGFLFRTTPGHAGALSFFPMAQQMANHESVRTTGLYDQQKRPGLAR